ncbi:MAG: stage II sporulation protein R [Clostridia bacterium]|nr:stage II sporulation protein R [Clostridia bacterium]
MQHTKNTKKFQKAMALILTLCSLILLLGILPVHGESEIYENVLRLHVLANSDSEEDQALKLKVRDAVLLKSEELFADCETREDAIEVTKQNLSVLEATARETLRAEGSDHSVRVELGEEVYPTRNYESFCFPAGNYLSLRIILGEGEGQNWWCVLYPPMCLSAASAKSSQSDEAITVGFTGEQYRVITETDAPRYRVRFRLLEVFEEAMR